MFEHSSGALTDLEPLRAALSREDRALLCCARVALDAATRAELHALDRAGLDYARLAQQAARHGLTPLLYRHLQTELSGRCPADLLASLGAATQQHALANLALCAELGELLPALQARGVDAMVVKGPVSALLCYGDLGLRVFSDLDVLVQPSAALAIGELLSARGYVPHLSLTVAQQRRLLATDSELIWRHPDRRRLVDVHWGLMPRGFSFTPDGQGPFATRSSVRVGATQVPTLGSEATLLFLLLHGMKHDFAALGWLCDIAELVRRAHALDWEALAAWSAPAGRRRFVDIGLALVHGLLQAPVPERLLVRGRADPAVARFAAELAARLFRREARQRTPLQAAFGLAYFRAMPVVADRLRYVHDTLLRPTSHEWLSLPLPEPLRPLYYAVRPVRLLAKYLRARRG
jgi:hypothetical protein